MFGYILINQPEMKFREYGVYHAFYCGLCETLRKKYGNVGRMTLSYDMTFLSLILTGLYEPQDEYRMCRCLPHPIKKHKIILNEYISYAADMNILLSYEKCIDDWNDERKIHKKIAAVLLNGKNKKVKKLYNNKISFILDKMKMIHECEQSNEDNIDKISGYFGEILGEIYVYSDDEWEEDVRKLGFFLGKFIYLMDAYDDIEKDRESNNYNPFLSIYQNENFDDYCHNILEMMMSEACRAFERLPIIKNSDVIRNILYSGVWTKYNLIAKKEREA